jgi:hypothetical protein
MGAKYSGGSVWLDVYLNTKFDWSMVSAITMFDWNHLLGK